MMRLISKTNNMKYAIQIEQEIPDDISDEDTGVREINKRIAKFKSGIELIVIEINKEFENDFNFYLEIYTAESAKYITEELYRYGCCVGVVSPLFEGAFGIWFRKKQHDEKKFICVNNALTDGSYCTYWVRK